MQDSLQHKIGIKVTFNAEQVAAGAHKYVQDMSQAQAATKSFDDSLRRTISSAKGLGAAYISLSGAKQFIGQVVNMRGQFQSLEVSFTTMLKSASKANEMVLQMAETAARTPFSLVEVSSGAKQLLAYGFAAEEVNSTLVRLGDIASGLQQPIGDIIYLYGTLRASGRVTTIDLRQFAGRGIPIYEELSKVLGKSKQEIMEMTSAGKIGFADIEKAFRNMTEAGGMFEGLMEKNSRTIGGQISNIQDNIDSMFNKIGQKSEGVINSALSGVSFLIENYETLGRSLGVLIATYGSYRAALIASIAIERSQVAIGQAKRMYSLIKLTETATQRQRIFNLVCKQNPYILLATAIAGVVSALVLFSDKQSEATRIQDDAQMKISSISKKETEHKNKIEEKISTIKDETKSEIERQQALASLKAAYPSIFEKYDIEIDKLGKIAQLKRDINLEIEKQAQKESVSLYKDAWRDYKQTNDEIKSLKGNLRKSNADNDLLILRRIYDLQQKSQAYLNVVGLHKDNVYNRFIQGVNSYSEKDISAAISQISREIDNRLKDKKKSTVFNGGILDGIIIDTDKLSESLAILQSRIGVLHDVPKTFGQMQKEARKAANDAQKALSDFNSLTGEQLKAWKDNHIHDANFMFGDVNAYRRKLKEDLDSAEDNVKKLSYGNNSVSNKGDDLAKRRRELVERQAQQVIEEGRLLKDAELEKERLHIEGLNDGLDKTLRMIRHNMSVELEAIKRQREDRVAKSKRDGISVSFDDLNKQEENVKTKARINSDAAYKENYNSLLSKHKDFAQRRLDIEREYHEEMKSLYALFREAVSRGDIDAVNKISNSMKISKKNYKESIGSLALEEFQNSDTWKQAFGDLELITTEKLKEIRSKISEYLTSSKNLTAEEVKIINDLLLRLGDTIEDRNPFESIKNGFDKFVEGVKSGDNEYVYDGAKRLLSGFKSVDSTIGDIYQKLSSAFGENSPIANGIRLLQDMTSVASSVSQLAAGIGSNDPTMIVSGAVGLLGNLIGFITSFNDREMRERQEQMKAEREYREFIRYERLRNIDTSTVDGQIKKIEALKRNLNELRKEKENIDRAFEAIFNHMGGLSEGEKLLMKEKNEDYKRLNDELSRTEKEFNDLSKSISESMSGISFDSLRDSLKRMLQDGRIDIDEMGEYMNDVFREAIINSIVIKQLEPIINEVVDMVQDASKKGTINDPDVQNSIKKRMEEGRRQANQTMEFMANMGVIKNDFRGSSGYVSGMTSDEARGVNAAFNSMRVTGERIYSKLSDISELLSGSKLNSISSVLLSIEESNRLVDRIVNSFDIANATLNKIAYNTSVLPDMQSDVKRIREEIAG